MDLTTFVQQTAAFFAGTSLAAVVIVWLGKTWAEQRIQKSIEHAYAKQLADYQAAIDEKLASQQEQREIRLRAALIADLLACWLANTDDSRREMNRLSFEAFLWLPQDVAEKLSDTLAHTPGAKSVPELIAEVRKLLLGPQDSLDWRHVISFRQVARHNSAARPGRGPTP